MNQLVEIPSGADTFAIRYFYIIREAHMTRHLLCALTWLALALSPDSTLSSPLERQSAIRGPLTQHQQGGRLDVQTTNGKTQFRIGEIIPLKLSFTSSSAKKYQINLAAYDRSGRMNYEKFTIQPVDGWSDPLLAYFARGAFMMGGLTNFSFLSQEPTVIHLDLNEWVRFDRPGEYSLRVVSSRVGELPEDKSYAEASNQLTSNELRLTIVSAGKPWQEETLKRAVATLDGHRPSGKKTSLAADRMQEAQTALKTVRYLGTAEAAKELARRFRGEDTHADFECMFGLIGSLHRDVALSEMQRLLNDPDHPVSSTFLYALTILMRSRNQSPETAFEEDRINRATVQRELLAAVSQKRGKALALTLNTVLETGGSEDGKPKPIDGQIAARIAAIFDQLPIEKQMEILEHRWELIKSPAFLPILRKYAKQYREFNVPNEMSAYNSLHLTGAALKHWYELAPDEARPVIIQEIIRPRPRYSARILGILPDKTMPEVEHALAEHFTAEQDSYAADNLASLLHRYATDAVLPQVLPVVDKNVGKWACAIQAPILAYLLRVNPSVSKPRIEAAMAARGDEYSACNHSLLMEVGALQSDPLLEEIAVRSLDDNDPEVAGNAAAFLGKFGSPAAEDKLWERLSRWSEKWRGREKIFRYVPGESNPNLWHGNLGMNLVLALASGKPWLADEGKLRRLQQLAVGSDMQHQVEQILSGWEKKPWSISYFRAGDQPHFRVLQYETDSLKALEEKLKQFADDSTFTWTGNRAQATEDERKIIKEVSEYLVSNGMKLSYPAN